MVIQRLILHTALVDELSVFYADVLALPVTKKENGIRILIGKSELLFEVAAKGTSPLYHFAFTIPSNKIEEARTWLLNKVELIWMEDYKSDIAEFVNWHARSVYFFDPAGNIVELIARADLKNESHEPFQSNQILSISEAGLVFPGEELELATNNLIEEYKISYFEKQPPLPQFKALGDDEGLFIIVPANRMWYPTLQPSGVFPMQVDFTNAGTNYHWDNYRSDLQL